MAKIKGSQRRKLRRERIIANARRKQIKHRSKKYLDIINYNDAIGLLRGKIMGGEIEVSGNDLTFYLKDKEKHIIIVVGICMPLWAHEHRFLAISLQNELYNSLQGKLKTADHDILSNLVYEVMYSYLQNTLNGNALSNLQTIQHTQRQKKYEVNKLE